MISKTEINDGVALSVFKVWGNCGMCEETIEAALNVEGIKEASWDSETKAMTVSYDTSKISLDQIHKNIANSGYDTEKYKADEKVYGNLHECCKYDRK